MHMCMVTWLDTETQHGMEQTIPLRYLPVFHPGVILPALDPKSLHLGILTLN